MGKDIVYHSLKDSMEGSVCPICTQTEHTVLGAMKSVLYESMTDPKIRNDIKDARGFCRFHAEMFLQAGDPLSHAMVYGDVLRSALHDIVDGDYTRYENRKDCWFCDMAKATESSYVGAFWDALHEEDFLAQYEQGGLLCMTHLHAMETASEQEKNGEELFLKLAQITIDKYQHMIHELDEIQRKSDYRNTNEAWTEGEKTAWQRAVRIFHDRVGLPRNTQQKKKRWFSR